MKIYLENNKFYVETEEKLVYEVNNYEVYGGRTFHINLILVAGFDYINPDESDVQGYVSAENFVEDVQDTFETWYIFAEGMEEALKANGYTILDTDKMDSRLKGIIEDKENR